MKSPSVAGHCKRQENPLPVRPHSGKPAGTLAPLLGRHVKWEQASHTAAQEADGTRSGPWPPAQVGSAGHQAEQASRGDRQPQKTTRNLPFISTTSTGTRFFPHSENFKICDNTLFRRENKGVKQGAESTKKLTARTT